MNAPAKNQEIKGKRTATRILKSGIEITGEDTQVENENLNGGQSTDGSITQAVPEGGHTEVEMARIGDVVTQPDGTKVTMGIDGETFPYFESTDLFDVTPDFEDENGGHGFDDILRIKKGEEIRVQFLDFQPSRCRLVRHKWVGDMFLVCPRHTSEDLLSKENRGRDCPLCGVLGTITAYQTPVFVHGAGKGLRARILRLNERMWQQLYPTITTDADALKFLFLAGRNDDELGSYFIEATREAPPKLERELARPTIQEPRIEQEDDLLKFAETVSKSKGIEPQMGRVVKWQKFFPGVPLVGFWWGRKKPAKAGYLDEPKVREWMRDPSYLTRMDEGWGIALFLTGGYIVIDLDRDEDVAEFIKLNSWAGDCMSTRGGRGIKFFVKLKGEYPHRVIHAFFAGEHVGEFRGATTAILDNLHPSGKLYTVQNEGVIHEIACADIVWLPGWTVEPPRSKEFENDLDETTDGGLLDLKLLKNVRPHPTKDGALQAQCPACAERNSDKSGNHLIIFNGGEGRYGCVVDQSPEHYARIFALVKHERFHQRERDRETIKKLARMDSLEYERNRDVEAKKLGISRVTVLDSLVAAERAEQNEEQESSFLEFDAVEPWPEPVDGTALLDEIINTAINPYIVCAPAVKIACALFALHTYAFDLGDISPILFITSATKRCGKTKLFSLFARLVCRPLTASSASPAAIYRTIELFQPTLLIDEVDAFLKGDEQLRGLINSGHTRDGAFHLGCEKIGEKIEPRRWTTWAPKIFSGIGRLAGTLEDRAIIVNMRRRRNDEIVQRLRYRIRFDDLRRRCARFIADQFDAIRDGNPEIPRGLNDRAADNWTPLLVLAEIVGGDWPAKARLAALELSGDENMDDADDYGVMLLEDMRVLFNSTRTARRSAEYEHRLPTKTILRLLHDMDERPWKEYGRRGTELNDRQLASLLKPFGVRSANIKQDKVSESGSEIEVVKGYYEKDLTEAFSAYLSEGKGTTRYSATKPENVDDYARSTAATKASGSTSKAAANINNDRGSSSVADKTSSVVGARGKRREPRFSYPVELPLEKDDVSVPS